MPSSISAYVHLDSVVEIPHDDKLIVRKMIKEDDTAMVAILEEFKRHHSYAELQVKLRKSLQGVKAQKKRHLTQNSDQDSVGQEQRIYSQNSQQGSFHNSRGCTPEKEERKKVITLDIAALREKI